MMGRGSFLKWMAALLAVPLVKAEPEAEPPEDFLLEEFKEAGLERKFQAKRQQFWLDRELAQAWERGVEYRYIVVSPERWTEIWSHAADLPHQRYPLQDRLPGAPVMETYHCDFGSVTILPARYFEWVQLRHGYRLLREHPTTPKSIAVFHGGPFDRERRAIEGVPRVIEVPIMDEIPPVAIMRTALPSPEDPVPYRRGRYEYSHPLYEVGDATAYLYIWDGPVRGR